MSRFEMDLCLRVFIDNALGWGFSDKDQVRSAVYKFLKYQRSVVLEQPFDSIAPDSLKQYQRDMLLCFKYVKDGMILVGRSFKFNGDQRREFTEKMIDLWKRFLFSKVAEDIEFTKKPKELLRAKHIFKKMKKAPPPPPPPAPTYNPFIPPKYHYFCEDSEHYFEKVLTRAVMAKREEEDKRFGRWKAPQVQVVAAVQEVKEVGYCESDDEKETLDRKIIRLEEPKFKNRILPHDELKKNKHSIWW